MSAEPEAHHLEPPLAQLEESLIAEFVRARGYDPTQLAHLSEAEWQKLLTDASIYASGKLMEVEARSHFVHQLHDAMAGVHKRGFE